LGCWRFAGFLFGGLQFAWRSAIGRPAADAERWEKMTPEEQAKFREAMRARCGGFREPSTETKASA